MKYRDISILTERVTRLEDRHDAIRDDLSEIKTDILETNKLIHEVVKLKQLVIGAAMGGSLLVFVVWELIKHFGLFLEIRKSRIFIFIRYIT